MDAFDYLVSSGYATHLSAAATRLGQRSEALRSRAAQLDRASGQCEWDGAGARAFRARQSRAVAHLRQAAELLDEAGRLLRSHAGTVTTELARQRPR